MTEITTINLFYPLLFTFLVIVVVTVGLVIKGKSSDKKDTLIFTKSSDNAKEVHIDTTDKMKSMHDNVIKVDFTSNHEHELHSIECNLKKIEEDIEELKQIVNSLLARVIELEKDR